jgi:hypothetical protein
VDDPDKMAGRFQEREVINQLECHWLQNIKRIVIKGSG